MYVSLLGDQERKSILDEGYSMDKGRKENGVSVGVRGLPVTRAEEDV